MSSNARVMSSSLQIANKQQQEPRKTAPTPLKVNSHYYQFLHRHQQQQQEHQPRRMVATHTDGIYMSSMYNERSIDSRTTSSTVTCNNYISAGNQYGDDLNSEVIKRWLMSAIGIRHRSSFIKPIYYNYFFHVREIFIPEASAWLLENNTIPHILPNSLNDSCS